MRKKKDEGRGNIVMGACFVDYTASGQLTSGLLRQDFEERQARARHEHGHSGYSGTIAEARGLIIHSHLKFSSYMSAHDHLSMSCKKWEEAQAVRYSGPDGKEKWLVGAWCAE